MSLRQTKFFDYSDETLVEKLAQGEMKAFDELYERFSARLLRYFFKMLGCEEKAQDFLQEIFTKVVDKPKLFCAKGSFRSLIFTAASNMCKNEYRRLQVRRQVNSEENLDQFSNGETKSSLDDLHESEFSDLVFSLLSELNSEKKDTFVLRFQQELSLKEIAEIMNCSEGTVKSRLFYTTRFLQKRLAAFSPDKN